MNYNFHTHTYLCGHATGLPEEYIQRAISCGIKHLGFSDHAPRLVGGNDKIPPWRGGSLRKEGLDTGHRRRLLHRLGQSREAIVADYLLSRDNLEPMLREGCAGQLPEILDGDFPTESKGCFAQAWSVGEMLRVFEAVEKIEK